MNCDGDVNSSKIVLRCCVATINRHLFAAKLHTIIARALKYFIISYGLKQGTG